MSVKCMLNNSLVLITIELSNSYGGIIMGNERMGGPEMAAVMKKKERLVGIIMAVIMSAVMGLLFAFLALKSANPEAVKSMPPAPVIYISNVLEAVIVGLLVTILLPLMKLGRMMCAKFHAEPPSIKFTLINSIPFAVINAVICSAVCSFIGIATSYSHMPDGKPPLFIMWFANWLRSLPLAIVLGYVLAILISPIVVKAIGLSRPD